MSLALALAFQAASSLPPDPGVQGFDLGKLPSSGEYRLKPGPITGCDEDDEDEIVVCGSRGGRDRYGLQPLESGFGAKGIPTAETGLFGKVRGRAYVESVEMPQGQISKRIMVGIKIPF